ncbi:serine/threonine-protein kinase [Carbonactinospora thermoautotrophica]|uniref:serine/threonine-protein kinase n=1 Tax=Carbonactinospora thermoautotrophica TaxID=1469144 RepID=UPI00099E39E7|nr:serine/threonine-protein kinase [Carbonactinospora thermoautotrophica]
MTSREAPLPAGAFIAPGYEVVGLLNRNWAYEVYDVWSAERDCRCVAKTVRADRLDDHLVTRLLREGRLLQRMAHPHLVRAYETIKTPVPVVILETLNGPTLAAILDDQPRRMPVSDLALLGLHLCSAMHYLHGRGFLHLDLKPSNVINSGGVAKVLDLSIARPPGRQRPGIGTRGYLAPEQARGGEVTAATDVWGIGITLFEAATGALPFDGYDTDDEHDEEYPGDAHRYPQLEHAPRSVGALRRLPRPFTEAINACLAFDPSARPSVPQLADALDSLLPLEPGEAAHQLRAPDSGPPRKIRGVPPSHLAAEWSDGSAPGEGGSDREEASVA